MRARLGAGSGFSGSDENSGSSGKRVPDPDGVDDGHGYESDPEPSTPQGPTGTQPDGSQPPSQEDDSNPSGGNQPSVGRGEKDLDSGSAGGNPSGDSSDPDPPSENSDSNPSGGNQPSVGRGEKDLDSGSAGGNPSGDSSDPQPPSQDTDDNPEPSTPQGPTGTQPDGSQPPSQDTDKTPEPADSQPPSQQDTNGTPSSGEGGQPGSPVRVTENAGDVQNAITPEQLQRIDDRVMVDVGRDDLRVVDGDLRLSSGARERLAEQQQDLRAAAAAATAGAGEMARTTDATDFAAFENAVSQVEQTVEEQNPGMESGEDFTVNINEEGEYTAEPTQDYVEQQREQANEAIAAQARSEGVDIDKLEAQTGRDIDADQEVTSPRDYVAQEVEESFDTVERGRDFRVVENDGTVRPEYTDEGLTRIETELETAAGGRVDIDVQRTEDGGIKASTDRTERFGDGQVGIPGVVPVVGGRTLEENLEGASETWQSFVGDIGSGVEDLADTGAAAVDALASDANPAAGPVESTLRVGGDIASAGIRGGGTALNLPGVALGFKEAGETTGWLVKQTAQGEGQQAVGELGQAGKAAASAGVNYAQQNPVEATGMVLGSLATGYGVTRAASSAGAGRAAAFAIDPAEEIGGTVLTKGLSQTARGSRVVDALGGRVDVESTARYVGRGAGNRVRDATRAASQSYESFKRSDFMTDTRGQQNLLGSSRSRGESTGDIDSEVTTVTAEDLDVGVQAEPSQLRARPQGNFEGGETGGGPRGFGGGREALPSRGVDSGGTVYERGYNPYGDGARASDDIRGQAESRYVRAESDLDARFSGLGRVDVATDTRARLAAAQLVGTRMDLDQRSRVDAAGRSDYRFDSRSEFETDVRVDTTTRMDTRTDTRLDSRIQTSQRTQFEFGQRAESRTAARFETRTDGRRRSEWEWDNDPAYSEEDPRALYQFDQDTWKVGIEDVGDVVFDDAPDGGGW